VTVVDIPARAQPRVRYEIAVVVGSSRKQAARAWIARLRSAKGEAVLEEFGFLPLHGT
jgi:ABC-type molybdate transport system substrate-binding protein